MKKNTIIRLVAFLMLAAMMLSAVACANTGTSDETTAGNSGNGAQTEAPVDETTTDPTVDVNGYKKDDLPEDLKFNENINILVWDDVEHEEFEVAYEDLSGDIVEQSLYDRNSKVEARLGLTLNFIRVNGNADNVSNFSSYVNNSVSINAKEFDVIGCYSLTLAKCASSGYLYNMLDDACEYLNFDQPWWSELLLEQATFGDNLYFASGDISRNALEMMYVCYANTALLAEFNLQNPQELVEPGDWTYDKFIEMCQGVYKDDGDGVKNCESESGDTFGYITSGIHVDPWFYGTGAVMALQDENGDLKMAESFQSEKVINAIDKINSLLWDSSDGIYTDSVKHQTEFRDEHLLFMTDRARVSFKVLAANENCHYTIVPCPKYDEQQENYSTVMGNPFTLYAIPVDSVNPSMASAVMECFASESFRNTTPAVFEITLKLKYAQDEVTGQMYDIIRDTVSFDIGRIFSSDLIGQGLFRNSIKGNRNSWASDVKMNTKPLTKKLEQLTKAFSD